MTRPGSSRFHPRFVWGSSRAIPLLVRDKKNPPDLHGQLPDYPDRSLMSPGLAPDNFSPGRDNEITGVCFTTRLCNPGFLHIGKTTFFST